MSRIIALVNQKGGVGKSTSVQNIGAGLALAGRKVLMIDLDPQGNLTEGWGIEPETVEASTFDVLIEERPLRQIVVTVGEGLDLAPANMHLAGAEVLLPQIGEGKDLRLKAALGKVRGYDYVLIDCPPSLGQLTLSALYAAREVFIPLQAEYYALRGIKKLVQTVDLVREQHGRLEITGIIATRVDARKTLNRGVIDQVREHFGATVFSTVIRDNVALAEAPVSGQDIFSSRPGSYGAEDYRALCAEIIQMEGR